MPGLGVADTARALAGIRAALEDRVAETARLLIEEPRLELKTTLAVHLFEDATAVQDLDARITDLGGAPDGGERADPEALLQQIDPLVDEATLRILTRIAHQRRRHADEVDPRLHPPRERVEEVDRPDDEHVRSAEAAAHAIAQEDRRPWEFRIDMARIAADAMRHAVVAGRPGAAEHVQAEQAVHARIRARWKI